MNVNNIPFSHNSQGPSNGRQPRLYDQSYYDPTGVIAATWSANNPPAQTFTGPNYHNYPFTNGQAQPAALNNNAVAAHPAPQPVLQPAPPVDHKTRAVVWKGRALQAENLNISLHGQIAALQSQLEQVRTELQNADSARQQLEVKNQSLERQVADCQKDKAAAAIARGVLNMNLGSGST